MTSHDPQSVRVTLESGSEDQTMNFASALAAQLKAGDVLAIEGALGAGKTCFVRGLARGLGIEPNAISSPTFVICQEHAGPNVSLAHIDAYRLGGDDELESIGWSELLADERTIVAVEWASRIAKSLPGRRIDVTLTHEGERSRRIVLVAPPELSQRISNLNAHATLRAAPVKCATCGTPIRIEDETFPFCSSRCRLADLGRWFAGRYKVSRPMGEQDIDELANEQ